MNLWQPGHRWLFLWQNRPSIIIGRFQNPWLECRMDLLSQQNIPLVRRTSGGGAVYHDQGNLCFSFFNTKWNQAKEENLDFIITSLKEWGIRPYRNQRHDLLHSSPEGLQYKISGSAFKQKKDRAIHHGTLLIQSDLDALKTLLTPLPATITSRALTSTPSPVANISDFNKDLTVSKVSKSIAHKFSSHIQYLKKDFLKKYESLYKREYKKISDWQWCYGETPAFTQILTQNSPEGNIKFKLEVCKGMIKSVHPIGHSPLALRLQVLESILTEKRYCHPELP